MNLLALIDGPSAAIVLGGTLLATTLRSGLNGGLATLRCLVGLVQPRFDYTRARAEIAAQVEIINRDGIYRAEPRHFGDREFDEVADTLIERRSVNALLAKHDAHRRMRRAHSQQVVATLNQAAETAPVFGLCGTLVSLSQLNVTAEPANVIAGSLSTAILTTLYGLLAAHFLFVPLSHLVRRKADAEEAERQKLVDWLAGELEKHGVRQGASREAGS